MNKIKSKEEQLRLVQAQTKSGLSVREFCFNEKIGKSNFYAWRKQFNLSSPTRISSSIKSKKPREELSGFVRIVPPSVQNGYVWIETPNGYKVNIGHGSELSSILELLRRL